MNKFWPFSFYFLFFAANAAHMPYKVLYFQQLGFNGPQIGLLTGIAPLITLATIPFWTRTADKTNQHRLIMSVCLLGTIASLIVFPFLQTFYALLTITLLSTIFMAPVMSLATSAAMFMLGVNKNLFGRIRMGGSFGFGISSLIVGFLVKAYDLKMAFWMAAAFSLFAFLVSLQLVYGKAKPEPEGNKQGIRDLLTDPNWVLFLIIAFIAGFGLAANNSYFLPYMEELGIDETIMGLTLAIGSLATIPVLFLANHFINRFQAYGTMILSVVFTSLRLILFGLTGNVFAVIIIQALNGLTGPLFGVAGVTYADQNSPESLRATGQGLFNTAMRGFGTAVGGFISGLLLVRIGGQAMYMVIGLAVLIILAIVVFLRSRFMARTQAQAQSPIT